MRPGQRKIGRSRKDRCSLPAALGGVAVLALTGCSHGTTGGPNAVSTSPAGGAATTSAAPAESGAPPLSSGSAQRPPASSFPGGGAVAGGGAGSGGLASATATAPSPDAGRATPPVVSAAATRACANGDGRGVLQDVRGYAGTVVLTVGLTASRVCTTRGYPGFDFIGPGGPLNVAAARTPTAYGTVTLSGSAVASFTVSYADPNGQGGCDRSRQVHESSLIITVPNTTRPVTLPTTTSKDQAAPYICLGQPVAVTPLVRK